MVAFMRIILARVQHVEDVYWDIYTLSWLETAEGQQLDNIGGIVGEARKGRPDEIYRLWVRARVLVNRSNGKQQELLKVLRILIGDPPTVTYTRVPPAAFKVEIAGVSDTSDVAQAVHGILREMKGAGIRMNLEYTDNIPTAFTFADDATESVVDHVKGFGDTNDSSIGGFFSGTL